VNSIYFATNAFLPVYLASAGRSEEIGNALTALNLGQLPASFLLLAFAGRVAGQGWPNAVAGIMAIVSVAGIVFATGAWTVAATATLGFAAGATLILTLSLPPLWCRPEDVAPTTAGMFTISYGSAVVTPIVSGAAWDLTGVPALAFVPIGLWAVVLFASAPAVRLLRAEA